MTNSADYVSLLYSDVLNNTYDFFPPQVSGENVFTLVSSLAEKVNMYLCEFFVKVGE